MERLNEFVTLFPGDWRDWCAATPASERVPGKIDAVLTDPPYGMDWHCDSTRFTGGRGGNRRQHEKIIGDDAPFEPAPWLDYGKVILWGSNHFGQRLPVGTTLVWVKKSDSKLGKVLSDAEVAWMKGGVGVYVYRQVWDGCAREGAENANHLHPTQKPINLFRWCIRKLNLPIGATILDPFAGSGTAGIAATKEGMNAILIEKSPAHCDTIRRRFDRFEARGPDSLFKGESS